RGSTLLSGPDLNVSRRGAHGDPTGFFVLRECRTETGQQVEYSRRPQRTASYLRTFAPIHLIKKSTDSDEVGRHPARPFYFIFFPILFLSEKWPLNSSKRLAGAHTILFVAEIIPGRGVGVRAFCFSRYRYTQ
ncbi:unnamed protein product, partial [Pylaiella littoralis]